MSLFTHFSTRVASAGSHSSAAKAINALGLDLLSKGTEPGANALLSPYSIQSALAMTFAGSVGDTRAEMAKVLHYPSDEAQLHRSFAELQLALEAIHVTTMHRVEEAKQWGGSGDPITLRVANRLFAQQGYEFRQPFLTLLQESYAAALQPMDFVHDAAGATREINRWVEEQTRQRIRELIPSGALDEYARLVLVNAVYLKAPWEVEFDEEATRPSPFYVNGNEVEQVATMVHRAYFGYARHDGFTAVTLPYSGGELQFLILLPDRVYGAAELELKLTPDLLAMCSVTDRADVLLRLPKFKLEPPLLQLGALLKSLGMRLAFDEPNGCSNFDRMAPRKPDDYLFISEVFHKTFLNLDEWGTEAAAATAVALVAGFARQEETKPITVSVDRPFSFAIQHRPSGACLFLGRVMDPR